MTEKKQPATQIETARAEEAIQSVVSGLAKYIIEETLIRGGEIKVPSEGYTIRGKNLGKRRIE